MKDNWSCLKVWIEFSKLFQLNNVGEESGILKMWHSVLTLSKLQNSSFIFFFLVKALEKVGNATKKRRKESDTPQEKPGVCHTWKLFSLTIPSLCKKASKLEWALPQRIRIRAHSTYFSCELEQRCTNWKLKNAISKVYQFDLFAPLT